MGGRFAMSDDSHGIDQIGTNYRRLLDFIQTVGIKEIHYVDGDISSTTTTATDEPFPHAGFSSIAVGDLCQLPFWTKAQHG